MTSGVDALLAQYDYQLPADRIARHPLAQRDGARMLCLGGEVSHRRVTDLPRLLNPGDLLVVNDTQVLPARIKVKRETGGAVELFLLENGSGAVRALLKPSRRIREGEVLLADEGRRVRVVERLGAGEWLVECEGGADALMERFGAMPLPPYMAREAQEEDRERYQTIFASKPGAVAAPTASLHLTDQLVQALVERGVQVAKITLHVGIGTFRNLREEDVLRGELHPELYEISEECVSAIRACRARSGRVIAVGTTVTRTLESATISKDRVPKVGGGVTRLFLREGARFSCVDGLMTNFHLPRSSLLMLVCAFAGRDRVLAAYEEAISEGYRFYSYGDSMLIL